ncbi:iron ABC transporter ATP-binding protein [Demequina zhanjiangensis]|uniref:ATP-binding cassette domain-containing protein n=1 Tax=Demequina zhanjiangensis TaxID=3051659 RepID=A0ABT8FZ21_9MICO|nr:ATP-binding cassette domain-containing protein [Demequina sp. SYSU T00b26]MDN4472133.1 ATP-binding cassette domain-containing protein [Demequina sp. SYSU T00b26]
MIAVDNLTKSYGPATVVDGVSLQLPQTGITSIIGPNGAGKSTLLSMITRILGADAGTVTVDGVDVFASPGKKVARLLSVLRQDTSMTARITVRELVEFGRFPHSGGRLTPECRAAVDEALAYCDLTELESRPIHELSGGQRQRAFVAMVLAQDTRYVLLDEPLNNLDMAHATGVMRLLRRLAEERGKSIVLVLHDINYASAHSDRIIAMRDGAVVHDGPPESVITPHALHEVYGMEFTVHRIEGDWIAAYYR